MNLEIQHIRRNGPRNPNRRTYSGTLDQLKREVSLAGGMRGGEVMYVYELGKKVATIK